MIVLHTNAYEVAKRFIGIEEVSGKSANPQILSMLQLDDAWPMDDSVPWCSAFVNYTAFLLGLPRSKSLRARSWLRIGQEVSKSKAKVGIDIVILKRGKGVQPGPNTINAPGHVGWFGGWYDKKVLLLGGNQKDTVSIDTYENKRILGIRRLI